MNLKNRILKKSNLWHVGALLLFVVLSCIYFAPALDGYALKQPDIVNHVGMSSEATDYRNNSDEQVQWTNSMFSGMPSTQISMIYEGTWLSSGLNKLFQLGLPSPIFYLFIYFLGFYVLALSLRIKPLIAIVGSIAFGFSSYFIIILEAGHNSKAGAIGFATLMVAGFIMAYRFKNWILGVALSSVFMTVELAANHVQITYYMAFVLFLLGIIELVKHAKENKLPKFLKVTALLVVGYGFAVMANYGNLFGTLDYSKQTIRGGSELTINPLGESTEANKTEGLDRDYVTNWSYGHGETFSFFVPNFKGGETGSIGSNEENKDIVREVDRMYQQGVDQSNQYWGDQPFTSGPVYIGIIVLFLAFLGLVYVKDKIKWALLSVTLLTIMLSWGKNYVSAMVLLPILLYNVNIFLDNKKQLIFSGVNTLILFFAMAKGELFIATSLTDFFLDFVPGYDKLRAVTIILVVAEMCIPLIGIMFLQKLFVSRKEIATNLTGFIVITAVFGLFFISMLMMPTTFNTFLAMQETEMLASVTDPVQQGQYAAFFDELEKARIAIFRKDVLRSFGFLFLGAGLVFTYIRFGFSQLILGIGLGLLILMDLMSVAKRYVNNQEDGGRYAQWVERFEMRYPYTAGLGEAKILEFETQANPSIKTSIDSALTSLNKEIDAEGDISAREIKMRTDYLTYRILNRHTNFRVYEEGNPYNSSYASYFNKSLGGYHGAKLSIYQNLIDFHLSKGNPSVVNMLNTKYFIRPVRDNFGIIVNSDLTQVNPNAMGNAWFSKEIKTVKNADEEILALESYNRTLLKNKGLAQVTVDGKLVTETANLKGTEAIAVSLPGMKEPMPISQIPYGALTAQPLALVADSAGLNWIYDAAPDSMFSKIFSLEKAGIGGWDPAATTIVDERFAANVSQKSYSGQGKIEMTSYHPDRMEYTSSSSEKQLAVFSEIYYADAWKAYVDDVEVPISKVNYVLRAIEVPAGDHKIRFEFKMKSAESAKMFGNIGSVAILLLLVFGIFIESKRKENEAEDFQAAKDANDE